MKPVSKEKSTIAWFSLADCVARGERERAITLCKLLMYSLDDRAFIKKLEADLLAVFNFEEALILYLQAADLYFFDKNYRESLLLYEFIVKFILCTEKILNNMIECSLALNDTLKISMYYSMRDAL